MTVSTQLIFMEDISVSALLFTFEVLPTALVPSKIMAYHFIELDIIWSIKLAKLLDYFLVNLNVSSSLGLAQASWQATALWLLQTGESFSLVEVKVLVCDNSF